MATKRRKHLKLYSRDEMKPVLMIHEFAEWMLDLPLEKYILTFDDGLYTQYMYLDELMEIETDKIFFISTGIVASEDTVQSNEFIQCAAAHEALFASGDTSHYMKWSQIKELHNRPGCEIGGHSNMHNSVNIRNILSDTRLMNNTFKTHELYPKSFCFPYNQENEVYRRLLIHNGYEHFYGKDRIDIYDIM